MEAERDPTWVLLSRPGMAAQRKGPFRDYKHVEQMVRDLYALHADATCIVIDAPHTTYPTDGREWVAMYGDRRYSLSGYGELSFVSDDTYKAAATMVDDGLSEKDARIASLEHELFMVRSALREPIARLYGIHPDDLKMPEPGDGAQEVPRG